VGTDSPYALTRSSLREARLVADFFEPPFTVFGAPNSDHFANPCVICMGPAGRVFETHLAAAEMVK